MQLQRHKGSCFHLYLYDPLTKRVHPFLTAFDERCPRVGGWRILAGERRASGFRLLLYLAKAKDRDISAALSHAVSFRHMRELVFVRWGVRDSDMTILWSGSLLVPVTWTASSM